MDWARRLTRNILRVIGDTFINMVSDDDAPLVVYISHTANNDEFFASVEDKTKEVLEHYKQLGLNVKFEMNPGNHMSDVDNRVAKGISNLLTSCQ